MSMWGNNDQTFAAGGPTVATDHGRAGTGLFDEHEAFRVHEGLPGPPRSAADGDVWPVLLGSPQDVFCVTNRAGAVLNRSWSGKFGINIPEGLERALTMARQVLEGDAPDVPAAAAQIIFALSQQALDTHSHVREIDRALAALQRSDDMARRLGTIPGIGPVGATALAASVTDPGQFRSGRQFAAWLGLTPLQNSSGGKERLGRVSKMGDKYLRKLLVIGATALVRYAKSKPETAHPHLVDLLAKKPVRVASVAMANKNGANCMGGDDARRSLSPRPCSGPVGITGRSNFS